MKRILLLAVLSAVAGSASAADNGFYTGTTIGYTSVDNPTAFPLTKSSDYVFGGFIGYRLNDNLGIEGTYTGLGSYENATQSGKADALSVAAVGFVPLGEKFELYGRLGLAYAMGKSSTGGLSNANRTGPTYGVGFQYNVSQSVGLRFGIDRYEAAVDQGSTTHNYNSDVIGATFVYRF
jgi:OmpA-OmpF porin, OOP family